MGIRWWQLGIEMRRPFSRETLWHYPLYAAVTGSFGYWLMGVQQRQTSLLNRRREALLEKRKRFAAAGGIDGTSTVAV